MSFLIGDALSMVTWMNAVSGREADPPNLVGLLGVAAAFAFVASFNLWRLRTGWRLDGRRRGRRQLSPRLEGRLGATVFPVFVGSWAMLVGLILIGLAFRLETRLLALAGLPLLAMFAISGFVAVKEFASPSRWNPGPRWLEESRRQGDSPKPG